MSSEIARLKSKFDQKNRTQWGQPSASAPPPRATPAFYEMKQRELKAAQVNAAKAAKQSAARYNLTLRALALSTAKKAQDERYKTMDEVQRARELASHYNATKRALKVAVSGMPKKSPANQWSTRRVTIQTKISEGEELAGASPMSDAARGMIEVPINATVELSPSQEESKSDEEPPKADEEPPKADEPRPSAQIEEKQMSDVAVPVDVDEEKKEEEIETKPEEVDNAFALSDVEKALKTGDDQAINEALVRTFLEELDPARAESSAKLLEEFKGKEEELMQKLLQETPPTENEQLVAAEVAAAEAIAATESHSDDDTPGFITSIVASPDSQSWKVTTVNDPQLDAFRSKLLAKGVKEDQVDHIMDDSSEML